MIAAATLLAATPTFAAEVGRTLFNGRGVILNDDKTWAYTRPAAIDCGGLDAVQSHRITFGLCIDPAVWSAAEPQGAQEFLFFSTDGKAALAVTPEVDYLDVETLRTAIASNAAEASGVPLDKIAFVPDPAVDVGGHEWQGVRYTVPVNEQQFAYLNYHISEPAVGTVQLTFWTEPGDEALSSSLASDVLARLKLD